jgi:hypothetical protein
MKKILLHSKTHGNHYLYYDDEDEFFVVHYTWTISKAPTSDLFYAKTRIRKENRKQTTRLFHRLILDVTDTKIDIDHRDHNGLNNQKNNLRVCTRKENTQNKRKIKSQSSKYKGVYFVKNPNYHLNPWRARIYANGKRIHLGMFSTENEAALAYNEASLKYFGEFAVLNDF